MARTEMQWARVLIACGVKSLSALKWAPVFAQVVRDGAFSKGDEEIDDFLGQILHESALLTRFDENLNYRAERLCVVWSKRFPTLASALACAGNPQVLAEHVYGGRMGNDEPGDGFKYRGRTPLQITGKDNYRWLGALMGVDLVACPELLEDPHYALLACVLWWENKIPDSMIGDVEKETLRVNGGLIGLADREQLTRRAHNALEQDAA